MSNDIMHLNTLVLVLVQAAGRHVLGISLLDLGATLCSHALSKSEGSLKRVLVG